MSGAGLFWLAPTFPLGVSVLLAISPAFSGRRAGQLAVLALAGSTLISALGLVAAARGARPSLILPWLTVGGRSFAFALALDPLGALVATLVSVVALVVFTYAASYMAEDPREARFFTIFSLFAGAMLTLVLAADLLTLFIAWELVGLCSYLLVGFWFERPGVPSAATKAFLTTRLADEAMLLGVLLLAGSVGTGRIDAVLAAATGGKLPTGLLVAAALLLFTGAAGKSAQVPFQSWLPDAMAGPTPVSALLHSATMVAAGVFLVARLYPLFLAAGPALTVVGWVGALTALLGGMVALVQTDLKRLLAYSTMSQLGLMFVGLGAGSLLAGVLLLFAQALYKSTLFLAAGAVDHAVGGTTFDRMGGLRRRMPSTCAGFALAAAALAGLPVTLAWPPKDPVLGAAFLHGPGLFAAALAASLLTALYSARALALVFLGAPSEPAQAPREVPLGLRLPVLALAVLIVLGLLADAAIAGRPLSRLLGSPVPETGVATVSALAVAVAGVTLGLLARRIWPRAIIWPPLARFASPLAGELGLRPLYALVARGGLDLAAAAAAVDRAVFDPLAASAAGIVVRAAQQAGRFDHAVFDAAATSAATTTMSASRAAAHFDLRRLDAAVTAFGQGLLGLSQRVRRLQTGHIENYLIGALVGSLGVIVLAILANALR